MNILQANFINIILILGLLFIRKAFSNNILKRDVVILWKIIFLNSLIPYHFIFYKFLDISEFRLKDRVSTMPNVLLQKDLLFTFISNTNGRIYLKNIWIIGVILVSLFFITMYIIGYNKYRKAEIISNEINYTLNYEFKTFRSISVKQSCNANSPFTYGIIKPVIIVPSSLVNEKNVNWNYILLHEYIHIKNYDVFTKLIVILNLCLYWFNPLIWLMLKIVNNDIELACDEEVIKIIGGEKRKKYAETLICLAEKKYSSHILSNCLSNSSLKERIKKIVFYKKKSNLNSTVILILCLTIILCSSIFSIHLKTFFNNVSIVIPSKQEVIGSGYPQNKFGETYGPSIKELAEDPELILVENDDGQLGYIKAKELENSQYNTPDEMYKENHKIKEVIMYLHDGETIIGKFKL